MKDEIIKKLNELKLEKVNQEISSLIQHNHIGWEGFFEDYEVIKIIDYLGRTDGIIWTDIVQIKHKMDSIKVLVQLSFYIKDDGTVDYKVWRREENSYMENE